MEPPSHGRLAGLAEIAPPETEALRAARARAEEAEVDQVDRHTGGLLAFLARLLGAQQVVEIGTGGGYSGLWLAEGMSPRGVLTTIEVDGQRQTLAQQAYAEAGVADRVRAILGPGAEVLPRLADASYDMVVLDADRAAYGAYLAHARRLLRRDGVLVALRTLAPAGPEEAEGLSELREGLASDPDLRPVTLPLGAGVTMAVMAGPEG